MQCVNVYPALVDMSERSWDSERSDEKDWLVGTRYVLVIHHAATYVDSCARKSLRGR